MFYCKLFMAMFLGVVFSAGGVYAGKEGEATRLDEVVISATMTQKALGDAPGSVEVITAREIKDLNALTVADALEMAVGLVVSRESGRVEAASVRGGRSKHNLVLLDGRRLAFGFNDLIDLRQIPTVIVERIEIVRGPASSLYGSDALGGVINIITKSPPDTFSGMAMGQYGINRKGEAKEYVGSAFAGGPLDRFRFLLSGEMRHKDGWDISGKLPDDGYKEKPKFAAGRFAFDLTENQVLSGGLEYMENTYTGGQFYENQARERKADEQREGYYLQYDVHMIDMHNFMLRVNRSVFENDLGFKPFAESGERHTEQYTNQAEVRYSGLFLNNHMITLGTEFRKDGLDDTQMSIRTDKSVNNFSLFLQDEFNIFDPLYIVLGLRYDKHSEFGERFSPRASLIYELTDTLRLKGSYGQGFRAPSLTELFVTSFRRRGQDVYEANPNLKAEKSVSYEVGIESGHDRFYAGLTAFYTDVDNLIESVFQRTEGTGRDRKQYFQYRNIAEATLKGIEAEGGFTLPMGFSMDGNFTWLDVENKSGGEDIGGQPEYKAFIKLGYSLPEWQLRTNLRMSYIGRMTYADGDRFSYPLFGAYLSKGFGRQIDLFAGVDNIFDKRIERNNVVQIEPTTFYAGVSMSF